MDRCRELLNELNKEASGIRPKKYGIEKKETFMVPMEDGKKLYTRIFFPKGVKKGILTFQRSCYEFQIPIFEWMAAEMAQRGYISGYQLHNGIDAYDIKNHEHDSCFGFNEAFRHMDSFFYGHKPGDGKKPVKGLQGYIIGEDRWIKEKEIRVRDKVKIQLKYLDHRTNGKETPDFDVEKCAAEKEEPITDGCSFIHDPNRPIDAMGGESMLYAPLSVKGVRKQLLGTIAEKDERIVSFYSDVLKQKLMVAGSIRVVLDVSSDAPDTAIVVKLMEEFEDGTAYNIRGGASTFSYRNGAKKRMDDYAPGEVVFLKFDLWPIMWSFKKGSRIRLDVSSSHFPEYHVHTNTKGPFAMQDKARIAINRIDKENVYLLHPVGELTGED